MNKFALMTVTAAIMGSGTPLLCAPADAVFELPALTQPSSNEHHIGKVIWADLVTPDAERAKKFYGALFGWSFRDIPGDPNYTVALVFGEPVAGIYQKAFAAGQKQQPAWLTFLAVRDVYSAQQATVRGGGKVLSKPRSYPHRGRQAVLADPEGAVFAIMAAQGGDPPDYLAPPGQWIWSSVLVTDTKRESAFYRELFGYQVFDLESEGPEEGHGEHLVLASDDYARAGLNALPADAMHRHPHWMNFVRVTDAAGAAQKAVALGGRVLVEPRPDRHGGQLAILADPSGAPFGVMEWAESDTKQEPQMP